MNLAYEVVERDHTTSHVKLMPNHSSASRVKRAFCREGQYLDATGGSFRAFMEGKLDQFPGISPLVLFVAHSAAG